jgi:DNA-binding response OmpR family regulator
MLLHTPAKRIISMVLYLCTGDWMAISQPCCLHRISEAPLSQAQEATMQTSDIILIVEDDAAIVSFMTDALNDDGYIVHAAGDLTSALHALKEHQPGLVLLDLHLDGTVSTALLDQPREDGFSATPVVLMTADTQLAADLAAQGQYVCLLKPFDLDDLFACVARFLRPQSTSSA